MPLAPGHTGAAPCSPEARRSLTFWLMLVVPHRRLSLRGLAEVVAGRGRFIPAGLDSRGAAGQDAPGAPGKAAEAGARARYAGGCSHAWVRAGRGLGGSIGRCGGSDSIPFCA